MIKLVTKLEISELFYKMDQIFKKRIRRYIRPILIEDHTYLTDESRNIIKTGFNIFILLTIFKEAYPTHASLQIFNTNTPFSSKKYKELKLKFNQRKKQLNPKRSSKKITPVFSPRKSKKLQATYIEFEKTAKSNFLKMEEEEKSQENDETEYLKRNSDQALEPKINKKLDEVDNEVLKIEFKEYFELKAMKSMKASLLFYKGLVGSVEVQRGECLSKIYFQKPFVSDFKTPNIKYNLIYMANRESDQARLEHLFYNVESYYQEMKHRQKIYRHHLLNFFIGFWRSLKDISFLLICAINVLLLASYEHKEAFLDANGNTTSDVYLQNILTDTNQIITAIQLFICFFVVIFCMIER